MEVLDQTIQRLQNGGIIEKGLMMESAKWRHNAFRSERQPKEALWVMDLLYLLSVGLLVATIVFLVELLVHRVPPVNCITRQT